MFKGRTMQVILAQPRGFCAGVERAIDIVETALQQYGPPIYVRHEIVHNPWVVENLKAKGVRFVEQIDQIPNGAITVFSAHGVSERVEQDASMRGLRPLDATCPLVSKVHVVGQIPGPVLLVSDVADVEALQVRDPDQVAYITQMTLSVDDTRDVIAALRQRFPKIVGPGVKDICYATQNRQAAVRMLASRVDLVLVVGAQNSSNSNRLCEVSNDSGVPSYLIEDPSKLDPAWLRGKKSVGITAGASTPEELVQALIEKLREFAGLQISTMDGIIENVRFSLPPTLDRAAAACPSRETRRPTISIASMAIV